MNNETAKLAASYLRKAADLIEGDRQDDYGDFMDNAKYAADVAEVDIMEGIDVMIGFKMARLRSSPLHEDSTVDMIGYLALREAVRVRMIESDEEEIVRVLDRR